MNNVRPHAKFHSHALAFTRSKCAMLVVLICSALLSSCDRAQLRQLINKLGRPDQEKPEVYHEFEGYSPGASKSKGKEDFSRYHYYIAPEMSEAIEPEPDIYFRQDYEAIDPIPTFDEEQYWRDHPITIEDNPTTETKTE